jgi:glyoxylase-like metal-dependent hydrolase (beta-lactamase superfamily II)
MKTFTVFFISCLCFFLVTSHTDSKNYLKKCWELQVKPLNGQFLDFSYRENREQLYHSPEPWLTLNYKSTGEIHCRPGEFLQSDTILKGEKQYCSFLQSRKDELLSLPYWSKTPLAVTRGECLNQVFELSRYSPVLLIDFFNEKKVTPDTDSDQKYAVYSLDINKTNVHLFIRKSDCLLEKVSTRQNHDILGDVTTTYSYSNFGKYGRVNFPQQIRIEKVHGITDEVTVTGMKFSGEAANLVERPADYSIAEDEIKTPETVVEKVGEHVFTIDLKHVETKVGLVEFEDFLVVLDAPLNSANGELIILEAKKIAPGKPIRYFAFGHHHPWYIGGVRAFIHKGIKVLSVESDIPYLQFIANAAHTLKPDSLHLQPKPLLTEVLDSHMTITDGKLKLEIYRIGKKSEHTNDYLVFYLPSEKLAFEGDLVWVSKEGPITKASPTQAGLYHAIKDLGIEVKTVIQTWPTGEKRKTKHIIPFSDIEESMKVP